jgi:hypothetical protein
MELVFDLIALVVELVWATVKFLQKLSRVYLPTVFYLTSVALIPALTLDKIVVEFPRKSTNVAWGWRKWIDKSPQGRITLSPGLGELAGLLLWIVAAALALLLYRLFFQLTR